jgi:Domain of unknown function (DUF4062)
MSKPRIFVSSTYYDLKHIRRSIESFIDSLGYEAVLFESGDIPFSHLNALDQSCYREIESCHMLVLIIGGRYGSAISDSEALNDDEVEKAYQEYNSITKREYETAREKDIPIYIFVEKPVAAEYRTYKENQKNKTIKYAHVDSVNIFKLIDEIYLQRRNNLTREFENVEDITSWLRDQWAGMFAMYIAKRSTDAQLKNLSDQVSQLKDTSDVLKKYTESIMLGAKKQDSAKLIEEMERKLQEHKMARALGLQPIRYLSMHMTPKPDPARIYSAITESATIDEFMSNFEFDETIKRRAPDGPRPAWVQDYERLKRMIERDSFIDDKHDDID